MRSLRGSTRSDALPTEVQMKAQHVPWFLLFAVGVILAIYGTFLFIADPGARMPPNGQTMSMPGGGPNP
jgi:hypothetical protein